MEFKRFLTENQNLNRSSFQSTQKRILGDLDDSQLCDDHRYSYYMDTATLEKIKREKEREKRKKFLKNKQLQMLQRENRLCMSQIKKEQQEVQKIKHRQSQKKYSKIDAEVQAINPINLQYQNTLKGRKFQQKENHQILCQLLRAKNLEYQTNRNFNLINGHQRQFVNIPRDILDRYKDQINQPQRPVRIYKYDYHI